MENNNVKLVEVSLRDEYGIVEDGYYYDSESYKLGLEKINIDNTVQYTSPISQNNAFYNSMLTAQTIDYYTVFESNTNENGEAWYKFLTNISSAHDNTGKGKYNINLGIRHFDFETNMYVYDEKGVLVASQETGALEASFNLDFGKTYYLRIKTVVPAPYIVRMTYDNVKGESENTTVQMQKHSVFLNYYLSELPSNKRIKKAELTLNQTGIVGVSDKNCKLGVFRYNNGVYPGFSIAELNDMCDYTRIVESEDGNAVSYTFDVTDILEKTIAADESALGIVIKPISNDVQDDSYITVVTDLQNELAPKLSVTYDISYAENSANSQSHELGFFGEGSVDLKYGNLTLQSDDFAWGGNRMPVNIKHIYNSVLCDKQFSEDKPNGLNVANYDNMILGKGFKLNIMQSIIEVDGKYIFSDENGLETALTAIENDANVYVCEDDSIQYNKTTRILKNGDDYLFDESGRLVEITDENGNKMHINYVGGKIASVTDGVNRAFVFAYNADGSLDTITAPDGTFNKYFYDANKLFAVEYSNGKAAEIYYTANLPTSIALYDNTTQLYKVEYTYQDDAVTKITEYGITNGVAQKGKATSFSYQKTANRTVVTDFETGIDTVYVFDNEGNPITEYIDNNEMRNAATDGDEQNENAAGYVSTITNNLTNHNFNSLNDWNLLPQNLATTEISVCENETEAKFGKHCLKLKTADPDVQANGIKQRTYTIGTGEYTFSAYVNIKEGFNISGSGIYLQVEIADLDRVLATSEKITAGDGDYVRVYASARMDERTPIVVKILADGQGEALIDAVQFERTPYPNAYNMLENSHFIRELTENFGWQTQDGEISYDEEFGYLGSLKIAGDVCRACEAHQTVEVKSGKNIRESFKLSGWAKCQVRIVYTLFGRIVYSFYLR